MFEAAAIRRLARRRSAAIIRLILIACSIEAFLSSVSPLLARQVGPDSDLCAEVNRLKPGEELVLLPGRYKGPCSIRTGGTAERPVVIRSADPDRPAVIVYTGRTANVLNIRADHVVVRGLAFESVHPEADGIRIYARNNVAVEGCQFTNLGGIAIVANHHSARGIVVRGNIVKQSRATAMYFGCHDGKACVIEELLIERNYIHGVTAPERMIGYGIQVKLNSAGIIRDNIIIDTKGPGIMVYGAHDRNAVSLIERNFVQGSMNAAGIVIGGGPVRVHNNISIANANGGIQLHDYGKRGLLRDVIVQHNTLFENEHSAVVLANTDKAEAEIAFNAVVSNRNKAALPETREGLVLKHNRDCSHAICFAHPDQRDFTPADSSILLASPDGQDFPTYPKEDFFGRSRGPRRVVGAVEPGGGPVHLGIKAIR
jgi:hypothetical protein